MSVQVPRFFCARFPLSFFPISSLVRHSYALGLPPTWHCDVEKEKQRLVEKGKQGGEREQSVFLFIFSISSFFETTTFFNLPLSLTFSGSGAVWASSSFFPAAGAAAGAAAAAAPAARGAAALSPAASALPPGAGARA